MKDSFIKIYYPYFYGSIGQRRLLSFLQNKPMKLLIDEQEILSSNDDKLIITNKRIILTEDKLTTSIFHENISSVQYRMQEIKLFLWLSILFAVIAFGFGIADIEQNQKMPFVTYSILIGLAFLVLWLYSKKKDVKISSDGGASMHIALSSLKDADIYHFVDTLQQAKDDRIMVISK